MNAIRIRKKIDAEIPQLPELTPFIGKTVEMIVLDDPSVAEFQQLETEATFFGLAPPPPTPEQQAANLAQLQDMARSDPKLAAFLRAVEEDVLDVERVIRARGIQ
jgi:hypothetical protein